MISRSVRRFEQLIANLRPIAAENWTLVIVDCSFLLLSMYVTCMRGMGHLTEFFSESSPGALGKRVSETKALFRFPG
jgi:hypothetical protein